MTREANFSDFNEIPHELSGISDEAILTFSWFVYGAVCPALDVFGIFTNIINIICFIKQGFQDSVNVSLFGMYERRVFLPYFVLILS